MNRTLSISLSGFVIASMTFMLFNSGCSFQPTSGGGTEGGNTVCGVLVNDDNSISAHARVLLIPSDYNPGAAGRTTSLVTTTTASDGSYSFDHTSEGAYSIEAVDTASGKRTLITGIDVSEEDITIPQDTLRKPGVILIAVPPDADDKSGYVYVPGTTIFASLSDASEYIVVIDVPAKELSSVCYVKNSGSTPAILRYNVQAVSDDTVIIEKPLWKHSRQLFLNTTATGANTAENVTGFPVLVRLGNDNFIFSDALPDGADIRFTKADNTALPYEIERWDPASGHAEIWIRVDTVFANDSAHFLTMYWGNTEASDSSNSPTVFDTAAGFQGVWHMSQAGTEPAPDATVNHFDGTPYDMNEASSANGMIGGAQRFNGKTSHYTLTGTADGSLKFPQDGTWSLSAWVYTEVMDSSGHYVISKGDRSYNLDLSGFNLWEIYDTKDGSGLQSIYTEPTLKEWKYLTGVRNGEDMRLYVDGVCMDSVMVIKKGVVRNDTFDVQIGKRSESDYGYWNGMLDEVIIQNRARSADWIRLCYMNQKAQDRLVMAK